MTVKKHENYAYCFPGYAATSCYQGVTSEAFKCPTITVQRITPSISLKPGAADKKQLKGGRAYFGSWVEGMQSIMAGKPQQ